ncbi:hamartin [Plakobranchus ocellatus]|uniref:Hamartin n=1 Tax=Plakobranchus ocellatus TaxID=259542 RepID=A0AAV4BF45_9GAST|nr:hamartin [Plakobranchus ocellatus]
MAAGGSGPLPVEHIFQLLDSADTVNDIREIILENLSSTKETWLIHLLVDHYFQTQSPNVQEIFAELKESQAKALLDKIQDGLKSAETRQPALQLVLFLAYREIPWCYQIVDTPLFSSILKLLRSETDVPPLMTSLMIIVILLPSLPVGLGPYLPTIFDIFGRMSVLCAKSPATTPEVFRLYLQVAIYSLFHRLYGMYPCLFMSFIRKFYTHKENIHIYEEIVLPMIERVRLHPKLIMGQKDAETSKNIWKNQETQDIIVACSRLSLDYIEGSWEDTHCPVFQSLQAVDKFRQLSLAWEQRHLQQTATVRVPSKAMVIPHQPGAACQSSTVSTTSSSSLQIPSLDINTVGESPSLLLGLSTPPSSQRATPASSLLDPGHAHASEGGTGDNTSGQQTPSLADDGEKTPLSRSSSRGAFQVSKSTSDPKKPAPRPAVTPGTPGSASQSLPWMSPAVGSGPVTTEASPFKSKSSAFEQPKNAAVRNLMFNSSLTETDEEHGEKAVPAITLQASCEEEIENTTVEPAVKTQQITESNAAAAAAASQESTLTESLQGSEDKSGPAAQHVGASQHVQKQTLPGAAINPLDVLSQVADKLSSADGADNVDQEVEEINEREDHFDESAALTSSSSTLTSQTELTAESVRQFMKKVNRIRFNSLTSNSSSNEDTDIAAFSRPGTTHHRPRSCPPFKRTGGTSLPGQDSTSPPRRAHYRRSNVPSSNRGRKLLSADRSAPVQPRSGRPGFVSQKSVPADGNTSSDIVQSEDSSDEITSHASPEKTSLKGHAPGHGNRKHEQTFPQPALEVPSLPKNVNAVFQCILAPSKLAVCNNCHQQLVVTSNLSEEQSKTLTGKEISLFSTVTPPELLDRHLRLGSDLHAKELTKIPLTSKETTNWTHFGGLPPADEISILRGQILLMQTQIMYERHKRCNHAKRNRRLLRRMTHLATLEEQQKSLMSKIHLYKEEVQQLEVSVRLLQEDNRRLRQSKESDEYEKLVEFRTSLKENKDLKASSIELKKLLLTQREDYDKQQKVLQLQNEVLLTQEFHQKCQEKLHQETGMTKTRAEESYLINALRAEIRVLKEDNKRSHNKLDAYQARTQELEDMLKAKDGVIAEIKQSLETTKGSHSSQLQAVEERCASLLRTNQHLESQIMELTGQFDQAQHRKMAEARRRIGQSTTTTTRVTSPASDVPTSNATAKTIETKTSDIKAGHSKVALQDGGDQSGNSYSIRGDQPFRSSESEDIVSNIRDDGEQGKDESGKSKDTKEEKGGQLGGQEVMQGSVPSHVETLPDSGAGSRSSYRLDSDTSVVSGLGQSLNTADSGCWPK